MLTKDWFHNPEDVLNRIEKLLQGQDMVEETDIPEEVAPDPTVAATPKKAVPLTSVPPLIPSTGTTQKVTSQPVKSPPLPASSSRLAGVRYFEFIGGASRKFWELSLTGDVFTVRFGRIGTLGQSQTKRFPDETKAQREAENLITEKLKKGYVEKS